jgi:hypothetical protein
LIFSHSNTKKNETMKTLFACGLVCLAMMTASGQENVKFTVEVSTDSVLFGNYFQVKFSLENASGSEFRPPAFDEFEVMSGPNMSSSFSMSNGRITQSVAYTYYLKPREVGNYYIQPASIKAGYKILETDAKEVLVVPNPDGVIQNPEPRQKQGMMDDWFKGFDAMPRLDWFDDLEIPVPPQEERKAPPKSKKKTTRI